MTPSSSTIDETMDALRRAKPVKYRAPGVSPATTAGRFRERRLFG
jgi:hypothetical protein